MSTDLLPTPAKSHYVFNLRDLSKCIQGEQWILFFRTSSHPWVVPSHLDHSVFIQSFLFIGVLQADSGVIRDAKQIFRLFCHESLRVFHDRLINQDDKNYFYGILSEMANKHFGEVRRTTNSCVWASLHIGAVVVILNFSAISLIPQNLQPESLASHPILFGDFMKVGAAKEDKMYEDLSNRDRVKQVLGEVSSVWSQTLDCRCVPPLFCLVQAKMFFPSFQSLHGCFMFSFPPLRWNWTWCSSPAVVVLSSFESFALYIFSCYRVHFVCFSFLNRPCNT